MALAASPDFSMVDLTCRESAVANPCDWVTYQPVTLSWRSSQLCFVRLTSELLGPVGPCILLHFSFRQMHTGRQQLRVGRLAPLMAAI